jgi:antitoxin component of RelBE/YafQ-DinJ toxin-antitoxin module
MSSFLEKLERMNVRFPADAKEWYIQEAKSLGMSTSQYISYVLVMHKRNQETTQALKDLSQMTKSVEVQETNKEMMQFIKSPEYKEMVKEIQNQNSGNRKQKRQLK